MLQTPDELRAFLRPGDWVEADPDQKWLAYVVRDGRQVEEVHWEAVAELEDDGDLARLERPGLVRLEVADATTVAVEGWTLTLDSVDKLSAYLRPGDELIADPLCGLVYYVRRGEGVVEHTTAWELVMRLEARGRLTRLSVENKRARFVVPAGIAAPGETGSE